MKSALLVALSLLSACADLAPLQRDHEQLEQMLAQVNAQQAMDCAPYDLAMAQAHQAFAELEFEEGDTERAAYHLTVALDHARKLREALKACSTRDTDGDGIPDLRDQCPEQPETRNGVDDEDGCPDEAPPPEPVAQAEPPPPAPGDADGDGLADDEDQCPQQAEDLDNFKDADGCPDLDNDEDGIPDIQDHCPDAPEDADGFQDEDGCPDPDNDGDGVLDELDQCPMEAEDLDGDQDGDGCPDLDRDHDGVPDAQDKCPDQPETVNQYLDEDGCPDTKPSRVEVTHEQIVIKEQIRFQSGKAVILPESYPVLDDVIQVMKDYPDIRVRIEGHTDSQGSDLFNLKLSKDRADAVYLYFVQHGIDPSRLETVGFGETRPIAPNDTPEGRKKNRRVEFHIVGGND